LFRSEFCDQTTGDFFQQLGRYSFHNPFTF
jgi:hypothetical protein